MLMMHWNTPIVNFAEDTMLQSWERYAEIPKGMDVQQSLYTRYPYHKHEGKIADKWVHFEYNCKDCVITNALEQVHTKKLEEASRVYKAKGQPERDP